MIVFPPQMEFAVYRMLMPLAVCRLHKPVQTVPREASFTGEC